MSSKPVTKPAVPTEPTGTPPPAPKPTHRCKVCKALWVLNPPSAAQPERSWSLVFGQKAGPCCDNVAMGEQIEALPPETPATPEVTTTTSPADPRIKVWEDEGATAYHNGLSIDANPHARDIRSDEIEPNHPLRCWNRGYITARKTAEPQWTGTDPDETVTVDPQVEAALANPAALSVGTLNTLYNRTLRQYRACTERGERLKRTLTRLEIVTRNKQHESELARPAMLADGTPIKVTD